jgi:hypothetical protein
MISIAPIGHHRTTRFGKLVETLLRVTEGDIRVVPSVAVPWHLFYGFYAHTSSFRKDLRKVIELVNSRLGRHVDVRASFDVCPPGFPEMARIRNEPRHLSKAILNLFSSWDDEKFRAFRIVERLSPPSTYPALLIQNHVQREYSLVSREPRVGAPIAEENCTANVNIVLESFRPTHAKLVKRVEACAGFPVKVIFTETPALEVCRVEKETMSVPAWLSALSSMKESGVLDAVQSLLLIRPEMVARYNGIRTIVSTEAAIASSSGLPASPGYAIGKILLPSDPLPRDSTPRIFVCIEQSPE